MWISGEIEIVNGFLGRDTKCPGGRGAWISGEIEMKNMDEESARIAKVEEKGISGEIENNISLYPSIFPANVEEAGGS